MFKKNFEVFSRTFKDPFHFFKEKFGCFACLQSTLNSYAISFHNQAILETRLYDFCIEIAQYNRQQIVMESYHNKKCDSVATMPIPRKTSLEVAPTTLATFFLL